MHLGIFSSRLLCTAVSRFYTGVFLSRFVLVLSYVSPSDCRFVLICKISISCQFLRWELSVHKLNDNCSRILFGTTGASMDTLRLLWFPSLKFTSLSCRSRPYMKVGSSSCRCSQNSPQFVCMTWAILLVSTCKCVTHRTFTCCKALGLYRAICKHHTQ